jgi:hypothetical protein
MSNQDISELRGVGERAADRLSAKGIRTQSDLRRALETLSPGAGDIYSAFQLEVVSQLDLPTIGDETVSQYTRRTESGEAIRYNWETGDRTYVLEMQEEDGTYVAEWYLEGGETFRSRRYDDRGTAVDALTRCAYRLPPRQM